MKEEKSLANIEVPTEIIESRIYLVRGKKVMLDSDLAELYRVESRVLIQSVKRNRSRFPDDFMFELTLSEAISLRSQFVISNVGRGGRRYLPYVFTELGVSMLSSVLKSEYAVQMNISIIRAFVKLREMLLTHKDLAQKIAELEREQRKHSQHLVNIYSTLKKLTSEPVKEDGKIGFNVEK